MFIYPFGSRGSILEEACESALLPDGDTNSHFFHAMASARRRSAITTLTRDNGLVFDTRGELGRVAHDNFHDLFRSIRGEYGPVVDCLDS